MVGWFQIAFIHYKQSGIFKQGHSGEQLVTIGVAGLLANQYPSSLPFLLRNSHLFGVYHPKLFAMQFSPVRFRQPWFGGASEKALTGPWLSREGLFLLNFALHPASSVVTILGRVGATWKPRSLMAKGSSTEGKKLGPLEPSLHLDFFAQKGKRKSLICLRHSFMGSLLHS